MMSTPMYELRRRTPLKEGPRVEVRKLPYGIATPSLKMNQIHIDHTELDDSGPYESSPKENKVACFKQCAKCKRERLWMAAFLILFLFAFSAYFRPRYGEIVSLIAKEISVSHQRMHKSFSRLIKSFNNQDNIFDSRKRDAVIATIKKNRERRKEKMFIRNDVRKYLDALKTEKKKVVGTEMPFIVQQCEAVSEAPQLADNIIQMLTKNHFKNKLSVNMLKDYALKSEGAEILSTFETEPYEEGVLTINLFGYYFIEILNPFYQRYSRYLAKYFSHNGPSSVIEPWTRPDECWSFKGTRGRIQIKLAERITLVAVTLEHIPVNLASENNISSAPKYFSITGIEDHPTNTRRHLGTFEYNLTGSHIQTFSLNSKDANYQYQIIELYVLSNHGNKDFTCVYKLRVHGEKDTSIQLN